MAGFALLMGHAPPAEMAEPAASSRNMAAAWALADSATNGPLSRQPDVALSQLREAYALSFDPTLLLEIGRLEREVGNLARATYAFEQFLASDAERVPEPRRVLALRQLQGAAAGIARMNVQTNVLGASVELEPERGVASASGFAISVLLDAGERRFSLSKPGYETRALVLTVEPGEVRTLRVDLEKAAGGRSETGSNKPRWTRLEAAVGGDVSL
ncbi:MAG: hypothetical protein EOO73_26885 [Myxococcales bacterium]|nr:MAG: hypothetical protein EOO73_26885 [Myxococcales bacterium]